MFSFSEVLSKTFNMFAHTMLCSAVFDPPKPHDPHAPPSLSPNLAPSNFFCFPDEKSPQRETFCHVEEAKQKTAEVIKGSSKAVEKASDRCIASNGEDLEGD